MKFITPPAQKKIKKKRGILKMGTINYKRNNYITIGLHDKFCAYNEIEEDDEYIPWECTEEYYIYENIKKIIDRYNFYYIDISIQEGYYYGFYLDFDLKQAWYNDCKEQAEANKEITQFKKMLLQCINAGLCVVYPGWCTSYNENIKEIQKEIQKGINLMREEVKENTWKNYKEKYFKN